MLKYKPMKKHLIFASIILLLTAGLAFADGPAVQIGSVSPDIELPSISGTAFNFESTKGKPVIVSFFTTWSKSCLDNLKYIQALKEKFKTIEIVAVSFDTKSALVDSFLKTNGLSFTTLIDKKHKYIDEFQILMIPSTFLIDKNGIVRNIYVNFDDTTKDSLASDLKSLMPQ